MLTRKPGLLVIIPLILISSLSLKPERINEEIIGKWALIGQPSDPYFLHDTIEILKQSVFKSSIVPNTVNTGIWKVRGQKLILKSCLHSADNIYKCRDSKSVWYNIQFNQNGFSTRQKNVEGKLHYRKIR